jgi:hypothetical protein
MQNNLPGMDIIAMSNHWLDQIPPTSFSKVYTWTFAFGSIYVASERLQMLADTIRNTCRTEAQIASVVKIPGPILDALDKYTVFDNNNWRFLQAVSLKRIDGDKIVIEFNNPRWNVEIIVLNSPY